jgi:opacity protein-like surface antigen
LKLFQNEFIHNFHGGLMKTKLAVVLALSSSAVFAQDLQLGDLNFFQKKGSVQWNTEVSMTKVEKKDKSASIEDELKTNLWSNEVTYGISDKFRLGLGIDYAFKNETENTKVPAGDDKIKDINNDGLSDVSIASAYRLMSGNIFVDVLGNFTVAIGDKKSGTSDYTDSKDGNYKQGHHSFDLGVAAGQKMGKFEWRAGAGVLYRFAGEFDQKNIGESSTNINTDSRLDMSLNGQLQYRPMPKLALNIGADWTKIGEQKGDLKDSGDKIKITAASHSILTSNVVVKYNLSDSILLNAGYRFTNTFDNDLKIKTPGGTGEIKGESKSSAFFLGGSFLF